MFCARCPFIVHFLLLSLLCVTKAEDGVSLRRVTAPPPSGRFFIHSPRVTPPPWVFPPTLRGVIGAHRHLISNGRDVTGERLPRPLAASSV